MQIVGFPMRRLKSVLKVFMVLRTYRYSFSIQVQFHASYVKTLLRKCTVILQFTNSVCLPTNFKCSLHVQNKYQKATKQIITFLKLRSRVHLSISLLNVVGVKRMSSWCTYSHRNNINCLHIWGHMVAAFHTSIIRGFEENE